jgi:hypothetical protein
MRFALFVLVVVVWCSAIGVVLYWSWQSLDQSGTPTPSAISADWACLPVPISFEREDLVGTWVADFGGGTGVDTLQLYSNGTFEQTYTHGGANYRYDGELGQWSLERRDSGGLYLHLSGMKFCAFEDRCIDPGLESDSAGYFDYCEREFVKMNGEFILAVVGPDSRLYDDKPSRGIVLKLFKPPG